MKKLTQGTLENGLRLISIHDDDCEAIYLDLIFEAGSLYENQELHGLAHLYEHLILKATQKWPDKFVFARVKDRTGAYSNARTSKYSLRVIFSFSKEKAREIFEILHEIVCKPFFSQENLEEERAIVLQEIARAEADPMRRLWFEADLKMFAGNKIAHRVLGYKETLEKITLSDLQQYQKKFLVPNNAALVIYGGLQVEKIKDLLQEFFSDWTESEKVEEFLLSREAVTENNVYVFEDSESYRLVLSFWFADISEKERIALGLINHFLTYGISSYLYEELRVKNAFTYSVSAQFSYFPNLLFEDISLQTTKPLEANKKLLDCLNHFPEVFTQKFFNEIRDQMIASLRLWYAEQDNVLNFYFGVWTRHEEIDTIEKYFDFLSHLSYEEVMRVFTKIFKEGNKGILLSGRENLLSQLQK
ncbi:MAG: insulinase family protein [Candidatus Harrisonbacteria bacterium]|nr:insulinase family protein [Candidatus Harrisonbacteria bacterium]